MYTRNTRGETPAPWRLVLVCILGLCAIAEAQTGAIRGQVVDPQGAIVAAAKVKLVNAAGTKVAEVESDAQGNFAFSSVDPGVYELSGESPAFVRVSQSVSVAAGQQREISVQFQQIV